MTLLVGLSLHNSGSEISAKPNLNLTISSILFLNLVISHGNIRRTNLRILILKKYDSSTGVLLKAFCIGGTTTSNIGMNP